MVKRKTSVITINNKDELCCARALVVAKARHHQNDSRECSLDYKNKRIGRHLQEQRAYELHEEAGFPTGVCGLTEILQF